MQHSQEEDDDGPGQLGTAMLASSTRKGTTNKNPNEWVLDSAATDHMSFVRPQLTPIRTRKPIKVEVGDGHRVRGFARGHIHISLRNKRRCGSSQIVLKKTLWVPGIKYNLLSARRLTQDGMTIHLSKGKAHILSAENEVVAIGYERNGLFIFSQIGQVREGQDPTNQGGNQ
jgi:hypothetical protein